MGRHLASRGIDTRLPALQPDEVLAAADLYQTGWSLVRIAQKLGTSENTVWRKLRAAGVQMRPRKGGKVAKPSTRGLPDSDIDDTVGE